VAIHVNDVNAGGMSMMMDSPKAIDREAIQKQLSDYLGDDGLSERIDIIIDESGSISRSIEKHTIDCDLLIVGHRKMSKFKSSFMDSIDEGITNLVSCPVLVVQK
jgi:nucleotide-binding universal stress UspA family protein